MLKPLVDSVFKLTLNRSEQANNTKELLDMCGLNASSQHCKPQWPSQIFQSEDFLNLSSGIAIPSETTQEILALPLKGKPIKENINKNTLKRKFFAKIIIWRGGKEKVIAVNRNILARLVPYSKLSGKVIDYAEALRYPLSPLPLSIVHPDGTMRTCEKADALKILLPSNTTCSAQSSLVSTSSVFIYDI